MAILQVAIGAKACIDKVSFIALLFYKRFISYLIKGLRGKKRCKYTH
jgi:hypothetical protein